MKVWRITVCYADGRAVFWGGSRRATILLARAADLHYADGTAPSVGKPDRVEVPTDKRGLIAWLNSNLSSDNG